MLSLSECNVSSSLRAVVISGRANLGLFDFS